MEKNYKINCFVTYRIIKLIDFESKYIGLFKLKDCLNKSRSLKLDLVEVGFKNGYSICKFINYNKFKYLESKKNILKVNNLKKQILKKKKNKEVKFHLFTAKNDYNNKIKIIKNFLIKGLKVKITFIIKGREILKIDIIKNNINNIIRDISNFGFLTNTPNFSNKIIFLNFDPLDVKK